MFDFSFWEFFVAAIVALIILGPTRLPGALRTLGLWIGRLRRNYYNIKTEIEREIGMDEVRRQLHNEQVMSDVKRVEREIQAMGEEVNQIENPTAQAEDRPVKALEDQRDSDRGENRPRADSTGSA